MSVEPKDLIKPEERWIPLVRQLLSGLRFGAIEIVVQDSKVVQVQKTEKVRLSQSS
ncbi:MAG TPA: YezD family protein [Verrucomicrobiae bacterium]|nr:YezD family protein [Verrucomicrobiae bacterium]